ncbi:hypothetical protein EAH76_21660 [Sphingomonas glacialis]|uniref:Integrase catalytic domain-containing protein n=1 Tax=Sphingomonas glacialis TaxID=658225 RepID=A0A502FFB7_9SPHN|nr:hypothetical protein EAH76_21660 [Sphingomonas glacialis]
MWAGVHLGSARPLSIRERGDVGFSRPGRLSDNAIVGSFNGRLRDEPQYHWFLSLEDVRTKIEAWQRDHNESLLTHRFAG